MRRALAALALLLTAPATASAAPFAELPFQPVSSAAVCLAPTGVPGGLVRWTPAGAELLEATPGGLVPQAAIALGSLRSCPVAALDPSGAGVVAGATRDGIRVVVRDPGGGWGAPLTLPAKTAFVSSAAVSARGDVVVAWVVFDAESLKSHVEVARRAPGASFGEAQVMSAASETENAQVALSAAGEAVLVLSDDKAVRLATAAPGAAFGAPRRLVASDDFADEPVLAMSPEGRALLVADTDGGAALFDREPGADFVRRPAIPAGSNVSMAMRPDGTAVLAWRTGSGAGVLRREGTGPFGVPIEVREPPRPPRTGPTGFGLYGGGGGPPIEQGRLRVALGADGRALIAWPGEETGLYAATVTAAGQSELTVLGSVLRPAAGMTPLALANGTAAVAWTDQNEIASLPPYAGRAHLAVEGAAPAPVPAAPELTVGAPRDRTLRPVQPLVLPVRCSAACDVRGEIAGRVTASTTTLTSAGTTTVRFEPEARAVAPVSGTLKVTVRWSAPGAKTASRRTVALRLRRLPSPPVPHLLNVRARRTGGGIVDVRWGTDGPARDAYFAVYGTRTRDPEGDRQASIGGAKGGTRRRSFHVRLRDAAHARYVTVVVTQPVVGGRHRTVRVRVQ